MEDYKKDLIMIYHIPVDNLSPKHMHQKLYEFMEVFKTDDFYREYFFPYTTSEEDKSFFKKICNIFKTDVYEKKIKIEIINLKDNKTEHIQIKLDELDDRLMKYFEKDKWLRKKKLQRLCK